MENKNKKVQQVVDGQGNVLTSKVLRENVNFVQLYRDGIPGIRNLITLDKEAANLYLFIIEKMDHENALMVSNECLAEIFEVSTRTIIRRVNILRDNGFLTSLKSGTSNVYLVNASVAWTTDGSRKQFAKFKASVLLSKSEQEYRLKASKVKGVKLN